MNDLQIRTRGPLSTSEWSPWEPNWLTSDAGEIRHILTGYCAREKLTLIYDDGSRLQFRIKK